MNRLRAKFWLSMVAVTFAVPFLSSLSILQPVRAQSGSGQATAEDGIFQPTAASQLVSATTNHQSPFAIKPDHYITVYTGSSPLTSLIIRASDNVYLSEEAKDYKAELNGDNDREMPISVAVNKDRNQAVISFQQPIPARTLVQVNLEEIEYNQRPVTPAIIQYEVFANQVGYNQPLPLGVTDIRTYGASGS